MSDDAPRRATGPVPPVRKSLGQHFLSDRRILGRIAAAAGVAAGDTVIEIGPGRGALTDLLLETGASVVAVEYDRALAELLRKKYVQEPRVRIVEADVLDVSLAEVAAVRDFKLVGNVPYYITTPILFQSLVSPRAMASVFLVQREVADRAVSPPGSKIYGALSVNLQALATVEVLFRVPAGAFTPPPKVESAVIRLTPLATPMIAPEEERPFRLLVQGAFGMRRKQLRRVVRSLYSVGPEAADAMIAEAGLDPEVRPETLSPAQFAALLRARAALAPSTSAPPA